MDLPQFGSLSCHTDDNHCCQVVKLNDEISNYRIAADKLVVLRTLILMTKTPVEEKTNENVWIIWCACEGIGQAEGYRNLGVYAAVVVGLYILVSLIGARH